MSQTKIEWTEKVWRSKITSHRIGIPICLYLIYKELLELKHCTKCKQWISIKNFGRDSSRGDGHSSICKSCRRKRPLDFKPKDRNTIYRSWYNRKGYKSVRARVHARKRNIQIATAELKENILDLFGSKCAYCGSPFETFDHLYPVSKGGDTVLGNLVPVCTSCNSSKKDKDLFQWSEEKGIPLSSQIIDTLSLAEVNGNGYFIY